MIRRCMMRLLRYLSVFSYEEESSSEKAGSDEAEWSIGAANLQMVHRAVLMIQEGLVGCWRRCWSVGISKFYKAHQGSFSAVSKPNFGNKY